jgi:multicomponent K+:H+ antiporter subunit A
MAGVPLLNGFISKEMFFHEAIEASTPWPPLGELLPYAAMAASMLGVAYSLRFIHGAFFGPPPTDLPRMPHEPPHWMRFPVELLVLACVLLGVFPAVAAGPALAAAAQSVLGEATPRYNLAVWHGFTVTLAMRAAAMGGGMVLFRVLSR